MTINIQEILHYFPEIDLPLLLSDDHIQEFESMAEQLPQSFIEKYLIVWENDPDVEITEYIPIGSFTPQENFIPIIYWKAGLLRYDFVLVTLNKAGHILSRKSIASTVIDGNIVKKSVASIEPDFIINIIAGHSVDGRDYDPVDSKAFSMEILPDGEIIFTLDKLSGTI